MAELGICGGEAVGAVRPVEGQGVGGGEAVAEGGEALAVFVGGGGKDATLHFGEQRGAGAGEAGSRLAWTSAGFSARSMESISRRAVASWESVRVAGRVAEATAADCDQVLSADSFSGVIVDGFQGSRVSRGAAQEVRRSSKAASFWRRFPVENRSVTFGAARLGTRERRRVAASPGDGVGVESCATRESTAAASGAAASARSRAGTAAACW